MGQLLYICPPRQASSGPAQQSRRGRSRAQLRSVPSITLPRIFAVRPFASSADRLTSSKVAESKVAMLT